MRRGFAPIIIVSIVAAFLIGIGATAAYFQFSGPKFEIDIAPENTKYLTASSPITTPATQPAQKVETANWKTYRNEQYGFEFKYPEKYLSHPPDSDTVLLLKSDKDAQTWDIRISWYVWDSGVKSINELTNLKNSVLLKIGSENVIKLSSSKESKQVGYIFIHNGKEYDFEVNSVSLKIMDDVGKILSTFTFN